MTFTPPIVRSVARIAAVGVVASALVAAAGLYIERARLGATDADALSRLRSQLTERFERASLSLSTRAEHVAAARDTIRTARRGGDQAKQLFGVLDRELPEEAAATAGLSVLDNAGVPIAWVGQVTDLPRERLDGPRALFVAPDSNGPRLVRIEPVPDTERPQGSRLATIVSEQRVDLSGTSELTDNLTLPALATDITFRDALPGARRAPYAFEVRSSDGQLLVEAVVSPTRLTETRSRWRAWIRAAVYAALVLTLLFIAGPVLKQRRAARTFRAVVAASLALVTIAAAARTLVWLAMMPFIGPALDAPLALLPNAVFLAILAWLAIDSIERWRVGPPRGYLRPPTTATLATLAAAAFVAAVAATGLLWSYERFLRSIAAHTPFDLLHFSLHPLEVVRLSVAFGLVLLHAAVIWMAAAILRLAVVAWRVARSPRVIAARSIAAGAGILAVVLVTQLAANQIPIVPLLIAASAAFIATAMLARPHAPLRRASQAARLGLLFVALLLPAMSMYPSVDALATASREQTIATEFAPQVARQREDLKLVRLPHALEAIEAMPSLDDFVTSSSEDQAPTTDRAFIVWSQTELATYRITSAVELYGPNGRLVSRFALILPEYGTSNDRAGNCDEWDLYEEVSPFGSTLRPVLRASRAICSNGRRIGSIVVRAMLDYRSLPFIASETPYVQSLDSTHRLPPEGAVAHDLEFAVYGWSRAPIYAPGTSVWPLEDAVFERMVASRTPLWTTTTRDGDRFRVYFFNDSFGIYALGYPAISSLGHLINLGELFSLTLVLFLMLAAAVSLYRVLTSQTPASGRQLLRQARSRFYRKLFIGFVASAVVPVVVLAFATRTYLVNQFRAGVEDGAVKTATVAQRLVEDYAALQQRGAGSVDDQFMVLVRWAIDQDVHLFDRYRLQATSERDLFASHLLSSRTPSEVYQRIVLDRLPTTTVTVEDVAGRPYLLAAAPVRTAGQQGIVTVPQPLRGQEIERQSDELDRRVLSVSVLFVLLGAAFGYWIAERIADPVNRLTRATRRIARGDLDARIATSSSDELRGLVEDFNQMADDLKRQRADLERTQRLEAWADMARQVAHDIKNPLTPIQLSAEHARRVNLDRGAPLSPVLDECVNAILSQVRLLRQISAEFSSFASSPTPRPEPTHLADLIEEVVEPYRTGLAGRIAIELHTASGLPEVFVDRTLFARALTNVIENALHAMPGGGTLTIATSPDGRDGHRRVNVQIRDTGLGMDADALAKIFEPYFSTKATGTGLGLTIAKRNVELNGGTISVASERGSGTTVTIALPEDGHHGTPEH
jgi:signal transduction histidine kinase